MITPTITGAKKRNSAEPKPATASSWKAAVVIAGLAAPAVYLLVR